MQVIPNLERVKGASTDDEEELNDTDLAAGNRDTFVLEVLQKYLSAVVHAHTIPSRLPNFEIVDFLLVETCCVFVMCASKITLCAMGVFITRCTSG